MILLYLNVIHLLNNIWITSVWRNYAFVFFFFLSHARFINFSYAYTFFLALYFPFAVSRALF